ncbi:AbrB/MazE/SpoVT family DNA-binding domain-containing protein [Halotia branconii]|uniref:AbrB/MazE/SpoVT family DNA-binding domain-containing protein n=1 Tax=Halotia branconii CENA392 TaxID=1539056 RepID=A0AAJ6NR58_9CYAN|nr:AbrB/MazE/SpoVT family DNA-binding domain-containing protein [Halotia branconii]WGV25204.1 AbrB/MazE/SpoVT family DNA-binding domain-containing protein [Halotia branconii CENA392]
METTRVSDQGQVIIPQAMRKACGWEAGQELLLIDTGDGILLKPKKPFAKTALSDVAGCLKFPSVAKTIEDMDNAISQGIQEEWHGRS